MLQSYTRIKSFVFTSGPWVTTMVRLSAVGRSQQDLPLELPRSDLQVTSPALAVSCPLTTALIHIHRSDAPAILVLHLSSATMAVWTQVSIVQDVIRWRKVVLADSSFFGSRDIKPISNQIQLLLFLKYVPRTFWIPVVIAKLNVYWLYLCVSSSRFLFNILFFA